MQDAGISIICNILNEFMVCREVFIAYRHDFFNGNDNMKKTKERNTSILYFC